MQTIVTPKVKGNTPGHASKVQVLSSVSINSNNILLAPLTSFGVTGGRAFKHPIISTEDENLN